ncbi:LacI family DNA-binding transcriptional regulator [Parabacteroides pacaensis]|uniref:LacI family DNA-binding transcriptional regulator n=1 Tax=Parabacteroides pacaensis TaxID=2086575 RepID=UPI000D0F63E7|nr:LacI family DNA-binding transcriptional regulator [Parabacteroides pacaensis]
MKRVSIKDIANRVGVSTAAVSLVLNGKEKEGRVGKAVADKIRQTAREMNYQPNRLARSLQSGHSQTIGLLVADISNPFFGSLAFYIQEEMEKANYAVIIMNTNESDLRMNTMITLLRSHQVDGFIIVPTESGEKYIRPLLDEHVPVVLLDRYYPSIPSAAVIINNYQASYQLTESLIKASCRRIALLIYKNGQPHMLERRRGYEEALLKANIFDSRLIYEVDYTFLKSDIAQVIHTLVEKEKK